MGGAFHKGRRQQAPSKHSCTAEAMPVHLSAGGRFRLVCYSVGCSCGVYNVLFRDYDPPNENKRFQSILAAPTDMFVDSIAPKSKLRCGFLEAA